MLYNHLELVHCLDWIQMAVHLLGLSHSSNLMCRRFTRDAELAKMNFSMSGILSFLHPITKGHSLFFSQELHSAFPLLLPSPTTFTPSVCRWNTNCGFPHQMPHNTSDILTFISEKLCNLLLGSKHFRIELWKWFPFNYISPNYREICMGEVQGLSLMLPSWYFVLCYSGIFHFKGIFEQH